jgi:membrane-associated PAP2 superfamily phosphatase
MPRASGRTTIQGGALQRPQHTSLALSDEPSVYGDSVPTPKPSWRLLLPPLLAIMAAVAVTVLKLDLWLADLLYSAQGGQWALKKAFVTERLLHVAGRNAVAAAWVLVLLALAATWWKPQWRSRRRPLAGLALSVLLSTVLISSLKAFSGVGCPWDLVRYGGDRAYVDIFSALLAGTPNRGCFPAGHASAGYAWLALFFFFQAVRPAWRWRGLTAGIVLGMVFGLSQQLRGAHFLSHDLWTAALCWLAAVAVDAAMGQSSQSVRASP